MKEEVKKKIYDNIDNSWEYVLRSAKKYKEEFKKTAKIGEPPHIDDILEEIILEDEIAPAPEKEEGPEEKPAEKKEKDEKTHEKAEEEDGKKEEK